MSNAISSGTMPPPLPHWARAGRATNLADAMLRAGACLGRLDTLARGPHPIDQLWRRRLALSSAAASMRLIGRREDEAALRDAWILRTETTDPGPGGQIYAVWRDLTDRTPSLVSERWQRLQVLISRLPGDIGPLADRVEEIAAASGNPVAIAARVVSATLRVLPTADLLALWLADWALAHRCGWPRPLPLLAPFLRRADLKGAADTERQETWLAAFYEAIARGSTAAIDLHADLGRKAERLVATAPALRAKGAARVVTQLLEEDAVSPSQLPGLGDRAGRRLVDRLIELKVVRELTGRATFRLYGL